MKLQIFILFTVFSNTKLYNFYIEVQEPRYKNVRTILYFIVLFLI